MTIDIRDAARWPLYSVPLPQVTGYQGTAPAFLLRTEVQGGPPRFRIRDPNATFTFSLRFVFTKEQAGAFENFFLDDLNLGLRWFRIPLSYGFGMLESVCHATEPYVYRRIGVAYEYVLPVEASFFSIRDLLGEDVIAVIDNCIPQGVSTIPDEIDAGDPANALGLADQIDVGEVWRLIPGISLPPDFDPNDLCVWSSNFGLSVTDSGLRNITSRGLEFLERHENGGRRRA